MRAAQRVVRNLYLPSRLLAVNERKIPWCALGWPLVGQLTHSVDIVVFVHAGVLCRRYFQMLRDPDFLAHVGYMCISLASLTVSVRA